MRSAKPSGAGRLIDSRFKPAWWLPGPHLQTLWPTLVGRPREPWRPAARRRIELADGDFIDLSLGPGDGPRVVLIHGLEGGLRSHYAAGLLDALAVRGYQPIFMHLRGRGYEPNRLDKTYHAGASDDLGEVLAALAADPQGMPLAAIGFSLGGNMLLKYMGETAEPLVRAAAAVSVPFVPRDAMLRLSIGFSQLYGRHLIASLKDSYRRKYRDRASPLAVNLDAIRDFNDYDDQITAPLNGFNGVFDYYNTVSSRRYIPRIHANTLIIHSADDPFMFPLSAPSVDELGPGVALELTRRGGHLGFVSGHIPGRPIYWLQRRLIEFIQFLD